MRSSAARGTASRQTFLGSQVLEVTSCASPADCRAKLAKLAAGEGVVIEFSFTLSSIGASGSSRGQTAGTGFGDGSVCTGGELTTTTLDLTASTLRIEPEITIADDYPETSDGFCTTDAAIKAAQGKACSQLEVLTADFVEAL